MQEARKIETVLVCYTQAVFDQLEKRPDDEDEPTDEIQQARYIASLAEKLVGLLKIAGCAAESVRVPQRSFAPRDISKTAFAWRILDLQESNGRPIDMVVCLDFPAWSLQHKNKVVWLTSAPNFTTRSRLYIPQENEATPSNVIKIQRNDPQTENARAVAALLQSERRGLAEAQRLLAGSRQVAEDLARRGLQVEYNPLPTDLALPGESSLWQTSIQRLINR